MDHLHAYWRMEYVKQEKTPAQRRPFVDLPKMDNDKETLILSREEHSFILMNRYPYNAGHLLILPYREVPDLEDLSDEELLCFTKTTLKAKNLLAKALNPNGFNIGINLGEAAGAGVPKHLHQHVVPRWSGDTNFMPVLGSTRVLPQSLEAMWEHLKEVLKKEF
ncbi:HIT domain-containing protein [Pelagicoccus sp. NFK12]|uniref:HIT domain-containing protein n=1 Tax=Pelagicoccus enzymogenes TaxID=2773457 RepID=A0A927FCP0_9BACT|nr:HIT domain-containing protein [Pelagicoccus enzymogenes]MBD5781945.1 HIT domain-containing protein [Pelagicoccus enzymogenes]MDQ8196701.1 HIT domain-containing protein [Pelagicoccus enzymogenes]